MSKFTLIEAANGAKPKVTGLAYSGGKMNLPGWKYPVVVDLSGMEIPDTVPLLTNHENKTDSRVGMITASVKNNALEIAGEIVSDSKDAQDITSHVPSYLPNGTYKIAPSSVENILMFLTEGDEESMYVYKYLFIDSVRQQASWSRWSLGGTIYGASFIEDSLYIVVERNDYLCLERVSFTFNTEDLPSEPYRVLLDCKQEVTVPEGDYNEIYDETTINVKSFYNEIYEPDKKYAVVTDDGTFKEVAADGTVVLNGDYTGKKIVCGLMYNFRIALSTIYAKTEGERGVQALLEGRLQLRQLWFNYANSGYFKVKVEVFDKDTYEYTHTGRNLGTSNSILGKLMFSTGKFTVPIQSLNTNCKIIVESDAPAPLALIGAGWTGNYVRRTRQF